MGGMHETKDSLSPKTAAADGESGAGDPAWILALAPAQIEAQFAALAAKNATVRVLTAPAVNSVNTFDAPAAVAPKPFHGATLSGETLTLTLPAKSIVTLELE
jgi:hypothetical protein